MAENKVYEVFEHDFDGSSGEYYILSWKTLGKAEVLRYHEEEHAVDVAEENGFVTEGVPAYLLKGFYKFYYPKMQETLIFRRWDFAPDIGVFESDDGFIRKIYVSELDGVVENRDFIPSEMNTALTNKKTANKYMNLPPQIRSLNRFNLK